MPFFRLVLSMLAIFLALPAIAKDLVIGYPKEINRFHDAATVILTEAYDQLGLTVHISTFPAERSLHLSNSGMIDGELVRIEGIDSRYPNLIRVPVSHVQAEQMAFASSPDITIQGWQSLRPYRIVFHRGYKAAERGTQGMNVELTTAVVQALEMVANGRADVAIANRFTGLAELKNIPRYKLNMLIPPVQVDPLYHYLHKKHAAIVPELTKILEQMRSSGRFERIYQQFDVSPLSSKSN